MERCPHCRREMYGPPDSPGLSRPEWMDDEEWAEYRMTEEARRELTYEPDYEPYAYGDEAYDRAEFYAEMDAAKGE